MKCITLILVALAATFKLYSQKAPESFYIFDADMKGTQKQENAAYFGRLMQVSDTCWVWDLYNYMGPKIKRIQYKDDHMQSPHGKLLYYNKNGYFDSTGFAYNNLRHGDWYYYNDTGKAIFRKQYDMGQLTSTTNFDTVQNNTDTADSEESFFPGGIEKWKYYLIKNMRYPERAMSANISGNVHVIFLVDTDGKALDPEVFKSVEFSIDEEAMRLITKSPKWTPGRQHGKVVKTYKRQPFVFRLQ
ncbi:MAG: energy transducer TonB [Chitinophagaceae bacterium]|nr:MAG: energy transducer TonB [Chitinophagaceae bacterium]